VHCILLLRRYLEWRLLQGRMPRGSPAPAAIDWTFNGGQGGDPTQVTKLDAMRAAHMDAFAYQRYSMAS